MARPLRIVYPGAFYYITSRGNERKDIFKSQRDREKFISYLESTTERYGALMETPSGNADEITSLSNQSYV